MAYTGAVPTPGSPSGRRADDAASENSDPAAVEPASDAASVGRRSTKKAVKKKPPVKKKASPKKTAGTKKKAAPKKAAAKKPAKKADKKQPAAKRSSAKHKPTTITRRVSRKRPTSRSRASKPLIGWREWVVLPEFTAAPIKAKVDSGAVTSSLHAFNLKLITDGDQTIARFEVAPKQGSFTAKTVVEHPVAGFKKVRSSNGQAQLRPVIRTVAVIGDETFEIDITLTSRDAMGFRMRLGRRAVRNRFVIDPGRSFLQPAASADGAATEGDNPE